jgi:hypothetical protein
MPEGSKCESCKGFVPDGDSVILYLECTDAIQFLLNAHKPSKKCLTEGLPYSENDVMLLSISARKARRVVHKYSCGKNKCCDECLLLKEALETFFYNDITEK